MSKTPFGLTGIELPESKPLPLSTDPLYLSCAREAAADFLASVGDPLMPCLLRMAKGRRRSAADDLDDLFGYAFIAIGRAIADSFRGLGLGDIERRNQQDALTHSRRWDGAMTGIMVARREAARAEQGLDPGWYHRDDDALTNEEQWARIPPLSFTYGNSQAPPFDTQAAADEAMHTQTTMAAAHRVDDPIGPAPTPSSWAIMRWMASDILGWNRSNRCDRIELRDTVHCIDTPSIPAAEVEWPRQSAWPSWRTGSIPIMAAGWVWIATRPSLLKRENMPCNGHHSLNCYSFSNGPGWSPYAHEGWGRCSQTLM